MSCQSRASSAIETTQVCLGSALRYKVIYDNGNRLLESRFTFTDTNQDTSWITSEDFDFTKLCHRPDMMLHAKRKKEMKMTPGLLRYCQ
jgi:hypothetical protein